ncbi:hypothetical protein KGF56_003733 [Candida oxycetoniae]|uniref:SH3 domain-containing protein n=1 Tax=Candida oxycetoniae TaxID=497107 RepID=A0AAI9SVG1_9ASCO|nr:uncharacterized protein KGF56_003733 [Candida oxycetoniae]KAI3403449.2 hypothetical protein KGF56_003733 [Candida oxycetoniae]
MVVDTFKTISSNVGAHIKDVYKTTESEVSHFSHNLKDTITFHHRDFDKDDLLIKEYQHDIKQARQGLNHLQAQNNQLYKKLFPGVLAMNLRIAREFIKLIGPGSLEFENIEEYYHEFDVYEASSEIPHVHPKEKQFLIESVNDELFQYIQSIENLKINLKQDCEYFANSLAPKINSMRKQLHEILKLIKRRNRKREEQDRLGRKIAKLNQKQPPLSEKDQEHLNKLQVEFTQVDKDFDALNSKTTALLPNAMAFLDEFIENVTKLLICHQTNTCKNIVETLEYFNIFYGFIGDNIPDYETISSQWEQDITTTRLQIESFLTLIKNKNPEIIDKEIDDQDKASKTYKFWVSMTTKLKEKKHLVKPSNPLYGMFNDTEAIDPIKAYEKYQNPQANQLETYHPRKILDLEDVVVVENREQSALPPPPPLPPRHNTNITISRPSLSSGMPAGQQPYSIYSQAQNDSMESLSLDDDDDDDDNDVSSIMSGSSATSSLSSTSVPKHTNFTKSLSIDQNLGRIYNMAKNEIKKSPITAHTWWQLPILDTRYSKIPMTDAYKLILWESFFKKLNKPKSIKKIAKYDFKGEEVGDLSFNKGDVIEIIFDFQNIDSLYMQDNLNWYIGKIDTGSSDYRIGLVPNNYLE